MSSSRREILQIGAGVAAVGSVLGSGNASAQTRPSAPGQAAGTQAPVAPRGDALRLVTFAPIPTAPPRVGVVRNDGRVVDLTLLPNAGKSFDPNSMTSLIEAGPSALEAVRIATNAADGPDISAVRLFAPIPNPTRNVYAVGWNYLDHFAESETAKAAKTDYPAHPVFFTKAVGTINGPYDPIPFDPKVSTSIDWEGELAVVIGRGGRNIAEADALNHVFGYTVINDTTARDVQRSRHGGQWFKGKSLDGHGPIGPWIIPAGSLDPDNLRVLTRVNGTVKQDASTKQMYFKVPRIIAELSLGLALYPGDIIATGTPPGVGDARKPPEYLKPGDVMETEIAEIGVLRNLIQAVPA